MELTPQLLDSMIIGCNRIAEGATRIGKALETLATGAGMKPVTAASLQEPTLEEACREYAADEGSAYTATTPAPAAAKQEETPTTGAATPEPSVVSLAELRSLLSSLSQAGHTSKVRELITATGANTLSEVDPTRYAGIFQAAKEIAHG